MIQNDKSIAKGQKIQGIDSQEEERKIY